jgi:hypothetical protein
MRGASSDGGKYRSGSNDQDERFREILFNPAQLSEN